MEIRRERVTRKFAIVTGAERGIGAGLATAFRRAGYAVVATSLAIPASDESDFLTVQGDITDVDTARHVVEQALDRFGRIDTLINDAEICHWQGLLHGEVTSDLWCREALLEGCAPCPGLIHESSVTT